MKRPTAPPTWAPAPPSTPQVLSPRQFSTAADYAQHFAWSHDMSSVEVGGGRNDSRGVYKLTGRMSKAEAEAHHQAMHADGYDQYHIHSEWRA